jgi:hypothetical protein
MPIFLAQIIVALISIGLAYVLVKSIVRGEIEWDAGNEIKVISRSKDPIGYWVTIFLITILFSITAWTAVP